MDELTKSSEKKEKRDFAPKKEPDPVKIWIEEISSNGNITIKFSTNLTVTEEVQRYLNYTRELRN